ncbi:ADP-dependent glucokinase/phosphofructokinase [Cellulomonas algicola]|uniref:ADP-dependent glucokinase/phosphofructokinase n=1 Tax=Cellulomonas algicola TaxID=2071633 RepID=UPI001C3FE179|nr:ADP-dependent glucokinase/phosphofructokinase [Cellulomonas algicola]
MSTRYVLGLGGTVDYELAWTPDVLDRLVAEHAITPDELDVHVPIGSERDLLRTLLAFVRDGVGGERFVASSDIVAAFAGHFPVRVTLGGTCVRAAIAMDVLGLASTVHLVSIDDHVRRLLPASTSYLCSAESDSLDPHLIVQFPAGTTIRVGSDEVVAPHPNRIIYVNDPPNRELLLHPGLPDAMADADVVLVSGFNVIQDAETLEHRLADVRKGLQRLAPGALAYFEDAGYHVPALARRVRDELSGLVDVYAMNEDELQSWLGRTVDLLDADDVAAALVELASVVPAPTRVVHTKHWALAHGGDAERYRAPLLGGITMAGTRYVHGDGFTPDDYAATGTTTPQPEGVAFAAALESVLPSAVCVPAFALDTAAPTTIGLGDTFVGGFLAAAGRA